MADIKLSVLDQSPIISGRTPGGSMLTAKAMNAEAFLGEDRFPVQVQELVGYLDDTLPPEYPYTA